MHQRDRVRDFGYAPAAARAAGGSVVRFVVVTVAAVAAAGCQAKTDDAPLVVPPLAYGVTEHWPDRRPPIGVGQGRLVVTNELEDTVSFFDLAAVGHGTLAELARVPVGLNPVVVEGPHDAAIDPAGEYVYVGLSNYAPGTGYGPRGANGDGTEPGWLLKLRAADGTLAGAAVVDPNPGDLVASPDGKTVYMSHWDIVKIMTEAGTVPEAELDARMSVVDTATMTRRAAVTVCPAPHGLRTSLDGRRVYLACYSDEVAIVDVADPAMPVTRVKVAPNAGSVEHLVYEPFAVAVSPKDGAVFVSCLTSGQLRVLDPATLTMREDRLVTVGGEPMFGVFDHAGDRLFVATKSNDHVAVVDPATTAVEAWDVSKACFNAHSVALTPDERYALVVCEGDQVGPGKLLVLDVAKHGEVVQTAALGVYPDFVGVLRTP